MAYQPYGPLSAKFYIYMWVYACVLESVCVWFSSKQYVGNIIPEQDRAYLFAHS